MNSLLFFSCPKPFRGHINMIQRNAVQSWMRLVPADQILLMGEDEGVAEVCREFGLRWIPQLERNDWGTPLVGDIFGKAQQATRGSHLCYINADIIVLPDFIEAVNRATAWSPNALLTGLRTDLDVTEAIDYRRSDWEEILRNQARTKGKLMPFGVDYLVFRCGYYRDFPPFAIGRTVWDNWLLWYHRKARSPLVTLTACVLAIHQNHSTAADWRRLNEHPETVRNRSMATEWQRSFTLEDATHELKPAGICRRGWEPVRHRAKIMSQLAKRRVRGVIGRAWRAARLRQA